MELTPTYSYRQPVPIVAGQSRETAQGSAREAEESDTGSEALQKASDPKVRELQAADTHVRAHEAAHMSAGGGVVTGGANFTYERGPDGRMYAVGGEVPIDMSEGNTPEATIAKAQRIRTAALAPSDPSPQDYKVAATATMMEMQARIEQMRELQAEIDGARRYAEQGLQPSGTSASAVNEPPAQSA